ncbi:MAG: HD domain-containing protein, partial [Burkholderiaceae bacterium]|nr:HD domain-containing protein [Burkholderiaceae bacterium]
APMHDIGKLGIPDTILLKSGKLSDQEMRIVRNHPRIGARILAGSDSPAMRLAQEIAGSHHERFDGLGYPHCLKGHDIPLAGRIAAVADVFDALTSERHYRRAWTAQDARSFIELGAGSQFCPQCVGAFIDGWEEVLEIKSRFSEESETQAASDTAPEAGRALKLCA